MCHYAGPPAMTREQSQGIQHHLRRLEVQIGQLSTINAQPQMPSSAGAPGAPEPHLGPSTDNLEPDKDYSGTIQIQNEGTRYMDPTHWQTVLDEVRTPLNFN